MRPVGDSISSADSTASHGALRRRMLEKLKPASGLEDAPHDFTQPDGSGFRKSGTHPGSRSGTDHAVPFRHTLEAPRLDAAFVAQLLGQLMPDRERPARDVLDAYREMPAFPPVLNKRI
jgi:hypothetical protein